MQADYTMKFVQQQIVEIAEQGMRFGLERMQYLLEKTNHPEKEIRVIHIGGTNGKGSTLNFLQCVLSYHGYQIGTFSSPSMIDFHDQIKCNEEMIREDELQDLFRQIIPIIIEMKQQPIGGPTEFEIMTILALLYFSRMKKTDYCIFEVGLGGKTDATNIVRPILTLLTTISLEHTQYLGHSTVEIAKEKSGIIKDGVPFLTTVKDDAALEVLRLIANWHDAVFIQVPTHFSSYLDENSGFLTFTTALKEPFSGPFTIQMLGQHQVQNAVLALYALNQLNQMDSLKLTKEEIAAGLYQAFWPGRMEKRTIPIEMILDGSHNVEGLEKLRQALQLHYPNRKITLLFSASADKDLDSMVAQLKQITDTIHITTFVYFRSLDEQRAQALAQKYGLIYEKDWQQWFANLKIHQDELLVITGSLYFISEVRKALPSSREGGQR